MCRLKLNSRITTAIVKNKKTSPPIGPGLTFEASNSVEEGNGSGEVPAIEVINLNIYSPLSPTNKSVSSTISPIREIASS
jgi:hypothetical protein